MASERSPLLLHDVAHANGDSTLAYATSSVVAIAADGDADALLATPSCGLSSLEAARRLKTVGANDLSPAAAASSLPHLLLRLALRPQAALVWTAIVLEALQAHVASAVALLVFLLATSLVAWSRHARTTRALAALHAAVRAEAVVVRDGVHQTINASLLVPGDRLLLAAGVVVPADCQLSSPSAPLLVDPSRLTGASLPVTLSGADSVKSGSVVLAGEAEAVVTATGAQTFDASVLGRHRSETPEGDAVVVQVTVALAVLAASALGVGIAVQLFEREPALRVASFALVVAAVAVPLALPAMAKLVVVLGAQRLLQDHKLIATRLAAVEKLARMDVLCCDKTGTLTRDKLELQDELPIFDPRGTREDVLVSAALAARWKEPPRDAVDTLVLNAIDLRPLDQYTLLHHKPFDGTAKRTESVIRGPTGRVFKVTKGAPESLLALAHNANAVRDAVEAKVMDLARRGVSSLAVARTDDAAADGKWVFLGIITYVDPPRHDSKRMIATAHDCGLAIKLSTGDQAAIAVEACRQLGMGMTVLGADVLAAATPPAQATQATDVARLVEAADGYAHVVPHQKVAIVQHLRQRGWACGVTGADVADVAAMEAAHLAVAVDGASDAARLAADVVLAKPGLSVIVSGVLGARAIFRRVASYVTFQTLCTVYWVVWITVTMLLVRPDACHFPHFVPHDADCGQVPIDSASPASVERVDAFFRVPVVALVVLGLIQELTSIALLHDTVIPPKQPQQWSLLRLNVDAVCVGVTAAGSTVLLMFWGLDGWNVDGVLAAYGVGSLSIHQIGTLVFLQVALAVTLSLLIVRTDSHPFTSAPSPMLAVVVVLNTALATVLALFSPFADLVSISFKQVVFVWVYALLWFFVQVAVKWLASVTLADMSHLGAVGGHASANRFAQAAAQRQNRMRLGLAFWSDESTVRDSFVLGRAVRSASVVHTQDADSNAERRLSDLEAAVQTLQLAAASGSSRSKDA